MIHGLASVVYSRWLVGVMVGSRTLLKLLVLSREMSKRHVVGVSRGAKPRTDCHVKAFALANHPPCHACCPRPSQS